MQVATASGFRLKDVPEPRRAKAAKHLKELEDRGFVLFVPGVGWVDSVPAVRRYAANTKGDS